MKKTGSFQTRLCVFVFFVISFAPFVIRSNLLFAHQPVRGLRQSLSGGGGGDTAFGSSRTIAVKVKCSAKLLLSRYNSIFIKELENTSVEDGSKLPKEFLIDADIYYSSVSDGYVFNKQPYFSDCRNGTTGYNLNDELTRYGNATGINYLSNNWYIMRSFFYFDTSNVNMSGKRATLNIIGYLNNDTHVIAQKAMQGDPLAVGDYDAFEGAPDGPVVADFGDSWTLGDLNSAVINSNDCIIDGTTKIVLRERDHDYKGNPPGSVKSNGCYFAEADIADPYIEIEDKPYKPQVILVN